MATVNAGYAIRRRQMSYLFDDYSGKIQHQRREEVMPMTAPKERR